MSIRTQRRDSKDFPPTESWYRSTSSNLPNLKHREFAKGFNVKQSDLYQVQLGLMRLIASIKATKAAFSSSTHTAWHLTESYLIQHIRKRCLDLPKRFRGVAVPSQWLERAFPRFAHKCDNAFESLVGNDSLDRKTGILTERWRKAFARQGVEKSIPQIVFDLD